MLGLVGESGSGKSVTAKSLMQLNPSNTLYGQKSSILLKNGAEELDVLSMKSSKDLVVVRGGAISMIFQEDTAFFPINGIRWIELHQRFCSHRFPRSRFSY